MDIEVHSTRPEGLAYRQHVRPHLTQALQWLRKCMTVRVEAAAVLESASRLVKLFAGIWELKFGRGVSRGVLCCSKTMCSSSLSGGSAAEIMLSKTSASVSERTGE